MARWMKYLPDNDQTMIDWVATDIGTINVVGTVKKYDTTGGDGVYFSIWKNNAQVWPLNAQWQHIDYANTMGAIHNFDVAVTQGDVISFRVAEGNTNAYDTTQWNPEIVYE